MSDELLLVLGCAITFIALAGAYVAIRAGFAHGFAEARADARKRAEAAKELRAPLARIDPAG
jgi:hypothetical protein